MSEPISTHCWFDKCISVNKKGGEGSTELLFHWNPSLACEFLGFWFFFLLSIYGIFYSLEELTMLQSLCIFNSFLLDFFFFYLPQ